MEHNFFIATKMIVFLWNVTSDSTIVPFIFPKQWQLKNALEVKIVPLEVLISIQIHKTECVSVCDFCAQEKLTNKRTKKTHESGITKHSSNSSAIEYDDK